MTSLFEAWHVVQQTQELISGISLRKFRLWQSKGEQDDAWQAGRPQLLTQISLRCLQSLGAWAVAGFAAYYLWVRPARQAELDKQVGLSAWAPNCFIAGLTEIAAWCRLQGSEQSATERPLAFMTGTQPGPLLVGLSFHQVQNASMFSAVIFGADPQIGGLRRGNPKE